MRLLKHIYSGLAAVAAMAMLPSCNSIMEEGGVCPESDTVVMSFKMLTSAPLTGTRADDHNHDEVDSEFREFEDGINVNDFAFFIFVGTGDDAQLVVKNTNIASSTDPTTMITGSPGAYTITVKMDRETLDAKLGHPIEPGSTAPVNFRFVVFANCYSPVVTDVNPAGGGRYDALAGNTFGEVVANAAKWGFAMDEIYSPVENDSQVDGLYKGNIPMYGTNDFTVTEGALYSSRPDERIYLGEVDLLRALAKVRVVDNIPQADKDALGFPRIEWVEFIGTQDYARQLPADAANYVNGTQVHTPNIFNPKEGIFDAADAIASAAFKLGTIPNDWASPAVTGNVTRIGYVPEQKIANANGNVAEGYPMFRITVGTKGMRNADGSITTAETEVYDVPMTGYKDQTFPDFVGNILRNHIYTLSVNQVKLGTPLNLTFNVSPWTSSRLELDYKDIPTVANEIEWVQGTYQAATGNNMEIYTLVWDSQANRTAAECSFRISAPLNTTWTATLVPVEGEVGAFKFLNAAGEEVDQIEGVTGIGSELQIVSVKPNPSQKNSAMLQVMVDMGYGYVQAPVAGNNGNYIISQRVN
jgi:hypothetical protein